MASHGNRRQELTGPTADHFVMVNGKRVYFSFGYRFGPLITDALGEPVKRQITSESHPFWAPFEKWLDAYKKTNPPIERPYRNPRDPQP